MDEREHTDILKMEAACCLWEAMLDWHRLASNDGSPEATAFNKLWVDEGTSCMRFKAIGLVDACLGGWDLLEAAGIEVEAYDWDYCAMVVHIADWSTPATRLLSPKQVSAAWVDILIKRVQLITAPHSPSK
jgi:hypothetical protein